MVIHFLKEESLAALKMSVKENIKHYQEPDNRWIYKYFGNEDPFMEYKIQIKNFQFVEGMGARSDSSQADVENAIRLYSAMKELSDTQATDERLWAGLCHGDFWEYMYSRWKEKNEKKDQVNGLLWRYFFNATSGIRRAMFRNTLSGFWWLGRLTYDEARKDPFELTRYWEKDFSTKMLILFSNNYMGNKELVKGLVSALVAMERGELSSCWKKRDMYYQASQYLNIYGGTHILDYYSAEEIKEKVISYMVRQK